VIQGHGCDTIRHSSAARLSTLSAEGCIAHTAFLPAAIRGLVPGERAAPPGPPPRPPTLSGFLAPDAPYAPHAPDELDDQMRRMRHLGAMNTMRPDERDEPLEV
jgi:hypothetical protein